MSDSAFKDEFDYARERYAWSDDDFSEWLEARAEEKVERQRDKGESLVRSGAGGPSALVVEERAA